MKIENLSRRQFLKGSLLAGGGLILGFRLPMVDKVMAKQGDMQKATFSVDAWIRVDHQGILHFVVPVSEMGQGSQTALTMILADEAGADYHALKVISALNNATYNNPAFGMQLTGGSNSVRGWWVPLRTIGATLRLMLVEAGAKQLKVAASECTTRDSFVIHKPSSKKIHFSKLVEDAATLSPPQKPALRPKEEYQYIGKPVARIDTLPKVNGEAVFGMDVVVPDMLIATLKQSPVFGGKLKSYNKAAAMKVKGVVAVVELDNGIAVVANNYWQARKGVDALNVVFTGGDTQGHTTESLEKSYRQALTNDKAARVVHESGTTQKIKAHKSYELTYEAPFLAHATMEPMNATAHITIDSCEVWAPTQAQSIAVQAITQTFAMQPDQVKLHTTYLGGGFGRRAEIDYILQAVQLSDTVGKPVKLIWSREEDMQHDMYRPAAVSRFKVDVDDKGYPVNWHNRVVNTSIMERFAPAWVGDKPDATMTEGAAEIPYQIANHKVDVVQLKNHIPVGFWRSVGNSLNCFFVESALDELANNAGIDPLEYRRNLIKSDQRALGVLNQVAKIAGWGKKGRKGQGQGIALTHSFGSYVGQVVEVSSNDGKAYTIDKIFCVVDCGIYINPSIVKRQMQSAITYGLTAALKGKIHFEDGHVVESNFHDYPALTLAEQPEIEVEIMENNHEPGGYGEPGLPPIAPALTNAIFAATGKRHTRLPLSA